MPLWNAKNHTKAKSNLLIKKGFKKKKKNNKQAIKYLYLMSAR